MKDVITITVPGNPRSWQRMRLDPKRKTKRGIPRQYMDPENQRAMENLATYLWAAGARGEPARDTLWELSGRFHCETFHRRDLDRLVSLVMDAAIGVVYVDDSQVRRFKEIEWVPGTPKGKGLLSLTFRKIGADSRCTTKTTSRRAPPEKTLRSSTATAGTDGEDP